MLYEILKSLGAILGMIGIILVSWLGVEKYSNAKSNSITATSSPDMQVATGRIEILQAAPGKKICLEFEDIDGTGKTYLFANNGALFASEKCE